MNDKEALPPRRPRLGHWNFTAETDAIDQLDIAAPDVNDALPDAMRT